MIHFFGALVLGLLTTSASCSFWDSCCNKTDEHKDHAHSHATSTMEKNSTVKKNSTEIQTTKTLRHITQAQAFDDLITNAEKPVIVKFETDLCEACKKIEPLFNTLAAENNTDYIFVSVDASKVRSLSNYYNIRAVPTILFIKNGKEIAPDHRIIGIFSRENFVEFIQKNTSK